MLKIQNTVVGVVFIFLKHNGLCGILADSNYFYTEESTQCTKFYVHACNLWMPGDISFARLIVKIISELVSLL